VTPSEKAKVIQDIQSQNDERSIAIDKVGVSDLRYPIIVLDRDHEIQHTIASLKMSVSLPHHFKGTHMSRFVEILNEHRGEVTMRTLPEILHAMRNCLEADRAHIEINFPYFIERSAPVSGARALIDYECFFKGESSSDQDDFIVGVRVPVTSLCPCSKAISDYGAHNQRGYITIEVRGLPSKTGDPQIIWIEELVTIAENSASAPVYALLKRPDERHVTMQAYDNPVFVEDMVRIAAAKLKADTRIAWFRVHAVNQESIHSHSAFAQLEWHRRIPDN
jgi:GTP cyclohydrolase I